MSAVALGHVLLNPVNVLVTESELQMLLLGLIIAVLVVVATKGWLMHKRRIEEERKRLLRERAYRQREALQALRRRERIARPVVHSAVGNAESDEPRRKSEEASSDSGFGAISTVATMAALGVFDSSPPIDTSSSVDTGSSSDFSSGFDGGSSGGGGADGSW